MYRCPECAGAARQLDTMWHKYLNVLYRYRECQECGHRFLTWELPIRINKRHRKEFKQELEKFLREMGDKYG